MPVLHSEEFIEVTEIVRIRSSMMIPDDMKDDLIEQTKQKSKIPTNSSMKTIFSISNSMVGSTLLVLGLNFAKYGIYTSLLAMVVMGAICCKTCLLEIYHLKHEEDDIPIAISRIIGNKASTIFYFSSVILLYFIVAVYFNLACEIVYSILQTIADHKLPSMDEFTLSKFSYQYLGVIVILLHNILFNMKDLTILLKLGPVGIFGIASVIVYSIVYGFMNLEMASSVFYFSSDPFDFATLCGIFSLSFFSHNFIFPILRQSKSPDKILRDTLLGYISTGSIYAMLGIFGAMFTGKSGKVPHLIFDMMPDNFILIILKVLIFIQLSSVLPVLWYVSRSQFFRIIYGDKEPPKLSFQLANIAVSLCCLLFQMFNIDPSLLIAILGALGCFLLVYVFPVYMHLLCIYSSTNHLTSPFIGEEEVEDFDEDGLMKKKDIRCVSTHQRFHSRLGKGLRYTGHSIIIFVGAIIIVFQLYKIFSGG